MGISKVPIFSATAATWKLLEYYFTLQVCSHLTLVMIIFSVKYYAVKHSIQASYRASLENSFSELIGKLAKSLLCLSLFSEVTVLFFRAAANNFRCNSSLSRFDAANCLEKEIIIWFCLLMINFQMFLFHYFFLYVVFRQ